MQMFVCMSRSRLRSVSSGTRCAARVSASIPPSSVAAALERVERAPEDVRGDAERDRGRAAQRAEREVQRQLRDVRDLKRGDDERGLFPEELIRHHRGEDAREDDRLRGQRPEPGAPAAAAGLAYTQAALGHCAQPHVGLRVYSKMICTEAALSDAGASVSPSTRLLGLVTTALVCNLVGRR